MDKLCDDHAVFFASLTCLPIQNFIFAPNYSPEGHSQFLCLLKLARKVIQQYLAFGRGTNAQEKSPH
jgi:hypothetical protein